MTALAPNALLPAFLEMEERLELFEWRERGLHVWEMIRNPVFVALTWPFYLANNRVAERKKATTPMTSKTSGLRRGLSRQLEKARLSIEGRTRRNPYRGGACDVLLIGKPRRKFEDGLWLDQFNDPLLPILSREFRVRLIEPAGVGRHLRPEATPDLRYLDKVLKPIKPAQRRLGPLALSGAGAERCAQVSRVMRDFSDPAVSDAIDVAALAADALLLHIASELVYERFLRRLRPKIVCTPENDQYGPLYTAARRLGIPSVELQHGSTVSGSTYTYPTTVRGQVSADFLFTYGAYWGEATPMPQPPERRFPIGLTYLRDRKTRWPSSVDRSRALVVSTPDERVALSRIAVELRQAHPNLTDVLWKEHPIDEGVEDQIADDLRAAGVRTMPPGSEIYAAFADCPTVIGESSTAIFEALAFDRRPQVLASTRTQELTYLVAEGGADVVHSAADVRIAPPPPPDALKRRIFAENSDDAVLQYFRDAIDLGCRDIP